MKAQYVGDIGDFGKVLLLKHFAALGFRIGINWVLTKNDKRADGKHRDYIDYRGSECLCCCDEEIFYQILPFAKKKRADRKIEDLEGLIRGFSKSVVFYSKRYVGGAARRNCEDEAFTELSPKLADMVFFDPDNGVDGEVGTSSKHVYLSDLKRYWARGQSILTYHHLSREIEHADQIAKKRSDFHKAFPAGHVYTYHLRRGTARVYILCVHEEHLPKIRSKDTIPAIKPLIVTKKIWAKGGKCCNKDHSARPAPAGLPVAPPPSEMSDPAIFLKVRTVIAGKTKTTSIGYVNRNDQVVFRNTGLRGTDHGQTVYQLGCSGCGHVYGANGTSIYSRKCPKHQGGALGLPYE